MIVTPKCSICGSTMKPMHSKFEDGKPVDYCDVHAKAMMRCISNLTLGRDGECAWCGAYNGESCRAKKDQ